MSSRWQALGRSGAIAALAVLVAAAPALAKRPLPTLPGSLHPAIVKDDPTLPATLQALVETRKVIKARWIKRNNDCTGIVDGSAQDRYCAAETAALDELVEAHDAASLKFIDDYLTKYSVFTTAAIDTYLVSQRWPDVERNRVAKTIADQQGFEHPDLEAEDATAIWTAATARGSDAKLAQLAAAAKGFNATGAGKQAHDDCAIYAIANAAGVPYSAAAAIATRFLSEGEWRLPDERADPVKVIKEGGGLNGGEVIMLAEFYGRARPAAPAEFEAVLKDGSPILVNLIPASANASGGHQIVLTKVFRDGGQTWYQAMDSNSGPLAHSYFKASEIEALIKESGIVYTPSRGTVPAPLK